MTTRVLVLGATGMLGHALLRMLISESRLEVYGSARSLGPLRATTSEEILSCVTEGVDAFDLGVVEELLDHIKPAVVINAIGVIKQASAVEDPYTTVWMNSFLPHALARMCVKRHVRLIHVSTDCVFSGAKGGYTETDHPDPVDFYGRSKLLGETVASGTLTLRTSIIGHELTGRRSLVDWFLSQSNVVDGYTKAIYSGVTTVELSRLIADLIVAHSDLTGLYHVASSPISKYDLLCAVRLEYGWPGEIRPFDDFRCDRSLSADALFNATGYKPPAWPEMIMEMRRTARAWGLLI